MAREKKPYAWKLGDGIPIYGIIKRGERIAKGRKAAEDTYSYDRKAEMINDMAIPLNFLITMGGVGIAGFLIAKGLEKFVY